MNTEGEAIIKGAKYIVLAAVIFVIAAALSFVPRRGENHDTWQVEVKVLEKVVVEIEEAEVYLLRTEDRDGNEALYEINKKALNERLSEEDVFQEIKEEKHYKFRVAEKETYGSHYPTVCGAVSLIDGFSQ
ncbi:MAG: hypothetical protein HFG75_11565 [Hungatella sp.]|nr:hypothetical protein [Hungatella sp.]